MYENWHLRRWETPMSDVDHLFMESLTDRGGRLQIEVGDYVNNEAVSRYRITFENYPAYRNILEEYRLQLWQTRAANVHSGATGWTLIVNDSPWIREFDNEPLLTLFNKELLHYVVVTEDDVIEVLSNRAPMIELIPQRQNVANEASS